MEIRTIFYDNQNWEYFINYKQQKHMYLKLKNQKIIVSAPFFVKKEIIEEFVLKNLPKLIMKINQENLISNKISFAPEAFIYFLDKKLRIIIKYQKQTNFFIGDGTFFIYTPLITNNNLLLIKKLNKFLKDLAWPILKARLEYWQKIMHIQINVLELKLMKSKWGICFPQLGKIVLNYKLIHFSYQVIDYVVIHELVHLIYPNHSKDFWNLVSLYCPDYKNCKNILKYSNVGLNNEKN